MVFGAVFNIEAPKIQKNRNVANLPLEAQQALVIRS
jgi:hypothetical protein